MTQKELIIEYIRVHGSILPAKCAGVVFKDQMLGSESSKRCRELRKEGILRSEGDGRFERFYLTGQPYLQGASEFAKKWISQWEVKKVEQKKELSGTLF